MQTATILPDFGAIISFSIFIASSTQSTSPSFTVSPFLTFTDTMLPGIGASTVVAPETGAEAAEACGAAFGAAAGFGAGAADF